MYLIIYSQAIDRRTVAQGTHHSETGKMAFTLLTKKGNRQQVRHVWSILMR